MIVYQVSSPYKVFNLLIVANMSEKTPQSFMGEGPFGEPRKPPSTHMENRESLLNTPDIILIKLAKNLFRVLKNEVRNKKSS